MVMDNLAKNDPRTGGKLLTRLEALIKMEKPDIAGLENA
jgi:hypothetical protein